VDGGDGLHDGAALLRHRQWFGTMDAEEIGSWMEEWLPGMMEWCFSGLDAEQRERMLGLCREMLDQIESEGLSQEA
jgi:hypothetical protein